MNCELITIPRHLRDLERRATASSHSQSPRMTNQVSSLATVGEPEEPRDKPVRGARIPEGPIQNQSGIINQRKEVPHSEPNSRLRSPLNNPKEPKNEKGISSVYLEKR